MATATDVTTAELRDVNRTDPFATYVRRVAERRRYMWHVARSELRSRQMTSVLGNLWHLLNPALSIGTYYLIFGVLLGTDRGVDAFFAFLTVGLFTYQFTQRTTVRGANSIVANQALIRAIRFPRAVLPLTTTITESLALVPAFLVAYLVAVGSGVDPSLRWLALPGVLAVQFVFNFGLALTAARLTTHFADTTQFLPFVFRLLLYGSGVLFNVDAFVSDDSAAKVLFTLNPVYGFVTATRWCLLGTPIDGWLIVSALVWTVVAFVGGFVWFRAGELRYARG